MNVNLGGSRESSWVHGDVRAVSADESIASVNTDGPVFTVTGVALGETTISLSTVPGTPASAATDPEIPASRHAAATGRITVRVT